MEKLKTDVFKIIESIYKDVVQVIRDAEKSGEGLDLAKIIEDEATHNKNINLAFQEAEMRLRSKKGIFG